MPKQPRLTKSILFGVSGTVLERNEEKPFAQNWKDAQVLEWKDPGTSVSPV